MKVMAQTVKNPPVRRTTLGWEDLLEKEMTTHSNILAWRLTLARGALWAIVHGIAKSWT